LPIALVILGALVYPSKAIPDLLHKML